MKKIPPIWKALLTNAIDYAGMFPPANLGFDESMRIAATWRHQAQFPWLLGRTILPLNDLNRVTDELLFSLSADGSPWHFSTLAADKTFQEIAWEITSFNRSESDACIRKRVTTLEWKVKQSDILAERFGVEGSARDFLPLTVFVELPSGEKQDKVAAHLAECQKITPFLFGIKVRTGGSYVPSAEELAHSIEVSLNHDLRFKATQGLHEAISHKGSFGFLNLFFAVNLKKVLNLSVSDIVACLNEEERGSFLITSESIAWRKKSVGLKDLLKARRNHCLAFGSCSLDEPQDSLKQIMEHQNEVG